MGTFDVARDAFQALDQRVAALEAMYGVTPEPDPEPIPDPPSEPTPPSPGDPNWQTALAAAKAGDVIVIPAGTHTLTAGQVLGGDLFCNLAIPSGVTLRGQGKGKTTLVGAGTTSCNIIGSVRTTGITVADMSIRTERYGATSQDGLKLEGVDGALISSVDFQNLYIASNCIGSKNVKYVGCTDSRCKQGLSVCENMDWQGTDGVTIEDCVSLSGFWLHRFSTQTARAKNVVYRRCTASGVEAGSGFIAMNSDAITLEDCIANNNPSAGFYLADVKGYNLIRPQASGNAKVDKSMEDIRIVNSTGTRS